MPPDGCPPISRWVYTDFSMGLRPFHHGLTPMASCAAPSGLGRFPNKWIYDIRLHDIRFPIGCWISDLFGFSYIFRSLNRSLSIFYIFEIMYMDDLQIYKQGTKIVNGKSNRKSDCLALKLLYTNLQL